ncbi:UDP-N-acetylglucosamine-N-acetylmuramylpentapeptide N-acetylglucosamine transferase [Natronincola peptidivorans]|uniref:UDP-N-acetylglucosamine--N-acetylmuramyl-(pentapeptide) pyrophosphoryl-undecaprenol N-acetylglucosamine transferase n=1 Tax=Natronincola peptidivorans TaxID=426128 RepID=A0A1H9Y703_9FIRM|nr:undecaprenyldiphospho-muramoylpentapeptide beta-N-acetylglucosaminyltransferase [Natronincola peptidivorans]SES64664.1 UDP-N-acetylglucosamine-N-acetylmuramylpentapeptide N-acetylglucosamine transferase [Natronincola peptidivorans]
MRVIISGGGTGGHIYPAIAIANKIKKENPKASILFIGTEKGMEKDIVPKEGYEIKTIKVSYLKRKISIHNIKSAGMLLQGLWQSRKIIKDFKPDIVIGTGGFVSGPVLYVASKMGIKTIIHEQNVFPGIANKILGNYVDRIAISFEEAERYFKHKNKLVVTGNPIRETFLTISKEEGKRRYKSKTNNPLVLVVGGSGGSISINRAISDLLIKQPNIKFEILLVTGKKHYHQVMETISKKQEIVQHHTIQEYINDMPYALKACDLIICSAGAITITEINAVGKPAILIPKAYTAENHQEYNARALEARGAALVIKERDLNSGTLLTNMQQIFATKEKLEAMKKASLDASKKHATDKIYHQVIELINKEIVH